MRFTNGDTAEQINIRDNTFELIAYGDSWATWKATNRYGVVLDAHVLHSGDYAIVSDTNEHVVGHLQVRYETGKLLHFSAFTQHDMAIFLTKFSEERQDSLSPRQQLIDFQEQ